MPSSGTLSSPAPATGPIEVRPVAGAVAEGPVIRRYQLGAELRRLREARPMRLADAADRIGVAASTLSRIETGKAPTRASYLTVLLDLYGITDPAQRHALAGLARD